MKSRGFTLVELLVVTGIIALLLGVSVVVLRAAREQARAVVCASNVRQLLLGLKVYEEENGTFPPGFSVPDFMAASENHYAGFPGTIDLAGRWWFDRSQTVDYQTMEGLDVLTCPSKCQRDPRLARDILCGNYGANLSICRVQDYIDPYKCGFGGRPLSSYQVRRPAETLLLADSGYSLISWWHATLEPPVQLPTDAFALGAIQHAAYVPGMEINQEGKVIWLGQTEDARGGRHPGKTVNVGFADGSLATKKADELLAEKMGDQLWNSSPLWLPGRSPTVAVTPLPTAP